MTMTIVEFLTARLDEMEARYLAEDERNMRYEFADIAAKWAIIDMHAVVARTGDCAVCLAVELVWNDWEDVAAKHPCETLRLLAQPFAGHPDFNPTWRV